ncbi:MAG: glycosyltransferase [Acidobacteriota bacterium]
MSDRSRRFEDAVRGLRVALVHDWLTGMRGGEKVLEEIAALFPGAPIYTLFCFPDAISDALRAHPIHVSGLQRLVPDRLLRTKYRWLLPAFPRAIEDFDLGDFDLVLSTSHCVAKGALPAPDALHLCYCHSPMRYAWDLEREYFPRRRGPMAALRGTLLSRLRLWDVASSPRVDAFWANSSFVARRIRRYYGRDADVLAPPIDLSAFAPGDRLGVDPSELDDAPPDDVVAYEDPMPDAARAGFVLAVSALVPYKRLDLAIEACETLGLELRIVGTGPEHDRLRRLAGPGTRLLGRVDAETLRDLMQSARLFLQPGIEDFGMSSVEALAAGTPVVALGRGGVCDIVVDGVHGVLYDGLDVADVTEAIDRALKIRFNSLKLLHRARAFSRDRFVDALRSSIVQHLDRHPLGARNRAAHATSRDDV